MIIKIDKKPEDLVIGVIGFRSEHILKALRKHNLECIMFNPDFPHPCDILIGSGVYSILPNDIITLPTYGTYIIHETPLPEGRGHAPIQWTLSNNLDSVVDSQKLWNALRLCDNKAYPAYITISGHKIYIKYYKDDNK